MRRRQRYLAGAAALMLLLGAGAAWQGMQDLGDMCANRVLEDIRSPNRQRRAVVFLRDCGATTGYSTQISVLPANTVLENEGGNLFVADHLGNHAVRVRWVDGDTIEIFPPRDARVFRAEARVAGVTARYLRR